MEKLIQQYQRLLVHPMNQRYALCFVGDNGELSYPQMKGFLTDKLLQQHLEGSQTVGVLLLQAHTNMVKFVAIDFDTGRDGNNLKDCLQICLDLKSKLEANGLKPVVEFSGRRGFHLILFLDKPMFGLTAYQGLTNLCDRLFYHPKDREIYPAISAENKEYKCLKLPGAVHRGNGKRSGFLDTNQINWDELGFPILPEQASLMASFVPSSADLLLKFAQEKNLKTANKAYNYVSQSYQKSNNGIATQINSSTESRVKSNLTGFNSNNGTYHSVENKNQIKGIYPCIQHLLKNGADVDTEYNKQNLSLARYCITVGIEKYQAIAYAEIMAEKSVKHPSSKNYNAKIKNFESAYDSAKGNNYQWDCAYILSGCNTHDKQELTSKGCIGEKCPQWLWKHQPFNNDNDKGKKLAQIVFKAIGDLYAEGIEIRQSTLLHILENLPADEFIDGVGSKLSDELIEEEVLATLVNQPELLPEIIAQDIPIEGFTSISVEDITGYVQRIYNLAPLTQKSTLMVHLDYIQEKGLDNLARQKIALFNEKKPVIDRLANLALDTTNLLAKSGAGIESLANDLDEIIGDIFGDNVNTIATPYSQLNNLLRGGFAGGNLYVFGGSPGSGKTTFLLGIGDYAAYHGNPVIVFSFEMSKRQLFTYAIARRVPMNSALIERKFWVPQSSNSHANGRSKNPNSNNKGGDNSFTSNLNNKGGDNSFTSNSNNKGGDNSRKNKVDNQSSNLQLNSDGGSNLSKSQLNNEGGSNLSKSQLNNDGGSNESLNYNQNNNDNDIQENNTGLPLPKTRYKKEVKLPPNQLKLFQTMNQAIAEYKEDTAINLHLIEATENHTLNKIKSLIQQLRVRYDLHEETPILVIIDYLQLIPSEDTQSETVRVSRLATGLKQIARDTNAAILAISDVTKSSVEDALRAGYFDYTAIRDSFRVVHAADFVGMLLSGKLTKDKITVIDLLIKNYQENDSNFTRKLNRALRDYPLSINDTYASLGVCKNRGGLTSELLFRYQKAIHTFNLINLEVNSDVEF